MTFPAGAICGASLRPLLLVPLGRYGTEDAPVKDFSDILHMDVRMILHPARVQPLAFAICQAPRASLMQLLSMSLQGHVLVGAGLHCTVRSWHGPKHPAFPGWSVLCAGAVRVQGR